MKSNLRGFRVLSVLMLLVLLMSGCSREVTDNGKTSSVKNGVYMRTVKQSDAADSDGKSEIGLTTAAVGFDSNGRVVSCELDAADITVSYTAEGKAVPLKDFSTKRELGDSYGMKAAGAKAEWYEQADSFEKLIEGKTVEEIKKLAKDNGYGNDEVISAGCTISIEDFIKAIEKASKN